MDLPNFILGLILGIAIGIGIAFAIKFFKTKTAKDIADELFRESEMKRKEHIEEVINNVKESFGNLSLDALSKSTEEFLKLAKSKLESEREIGVKELDAKKGLIDQQLEKMTGELEKASKLIKDLEKDRENKFAKLTEQLKLTGEQTLTLTQTTQKLREALASSKTRGQWGERIAEDILRVAGFIENVNYLKQKTIEGVGSKPDFTFLLPRNLKLNMDSKFPWDNYIKCIEAKSNAEKESFGKSFLRDIRDKIKEVTSREYINPEQNTVDYVLLFIPSDQIYSFIHQQDSTIIDHAIKNKVVFCSPITLFAVLAVIRQAIDNFALEQTSNEILSLLGAFHNQWSKFIDKLEQLGKRIQDAQRHYDQLTTTRRRQLEKPLSKIEEIRTQRGLPIIPEEEIKEISSEIEETKESEKQE